MIVGVGKAGTTSLFWYLSQHPEICASKVKETRYFAALAEGTGALPPIEEYAQHFRGCSDEPFVLEASPQYFHGGPAVIEALRATLERPRIVVSLRDPVTRLWSFYRFVKSRMGPLPESLPFADYVAESLRVREEGAARTEENRAYWALSGGFYVETLVPWLEAFGDDLRVVFFEHLAERPSAVVADLCRWLGIDERVAETLTYSVENRTMPIRSKALQRVALALNDERLLGRRRRLKAPLRKLYYAVNRKRGAERMPPEAARSLTELYRGSNAELGELLRSRGYRDLPAWVSGAVESAASPDR